MFSAAPVPIMLLDVKAQRYTEINECAIALLGYRREQGADCLFDRSGDLKVDAVKRISAPQKNERIVIRASPHG